MIRSWAELASELHTVIVFRNYRQHTFKRPAKSHVQDLRPSVLVSKGDHLHTAFKLAAYQEELGHNGYVFYCVNQDVHAGERNKILKVSQFGKKSELEYGAVQRERVLAPIAHTMVTMHSECAETWCRASNADPHLFARM